MSELDSALGAFALALVIAYITTPIAVRVAWRVGAIDTPRARGLHTFPTPRLGGLAILVAVAVSALIFLDPNQETRGILGGAIVIAFVGAADDLLELSADVKLLGQILAAVIPVAAGVRVEDFTLPFVGRVELGDLSYPATVAGMVAVMNLSLIHI